MMRILSITCIAFLFFNILGFSAFSQNQIAITELTKKLNVAKADSDKVKILGDLSWELQTFNIDKAEEYASQEMELAKKVNTKSILALAYNDLCLIKIRRGSLDEALRLIEVAYKYRKELGDVLGMGSALNKMGSIYQKQENNQKALECFIACLKIYEKTNLKMQYAYCLNNVGTVYFNLHQSNKALPYYKQAMLINRENNDKQNLAGNLGNIANIYIEQKKFDSAIVYLDESIKLLELIGNKYGIHVSYNSMALAYKYSGKLALALPYNKKALATSEAIQDTNGMVLYMLNEANTLLQLKQPKEAKPLIDRADVLTKKASLRNYMRQVCTQYIHYYIMVNDPDQAEKYFELNDALRDSSFNQILNQQIAEMETKYETNKKEEENIVLKKDNKIKSLTLWFLIVGLALVIIAFILIYNRYKLKQKAIMQEALLNQQELRSKAVLEAEEFERQRIAKDLHDGLGQMLSAVKLNLSSLESKLPSIQPEHHQLFVNAISLVDDSVKEVRTISHNMMPNMLIKKGLVNAVREFIDKLNGTTLKIDLEISGLNERLDASLESILYRTLQEIINNVIKHSNATHITIQLLRFENDITLMVEDNGKGFDVESTLNSDKGIGLKNIMSRVDYFKGTTNFDSHMGKGTTVSIEIPINATFK